VQDAIELVSPAFFGLDIGVTENGPNLPEGVRVDQFDTGGVLNRALVLARQVAADPSYVAVVIAPFWSEPPAVARVFADAGLPVLSLSPVGVSGGATGGATGDAARSWRELVPNQAVQARTLARVLDGAVVTGGLCLGTDPSPYSASLSSQVSAALNRPASASFQLRGAGPVGPIVQLVRRTGCSTVAWIGFPQGAVVLRDGLTAAGLGGVRLVGADPMKTLSYTQQMGRDGTLVTCPCQDITTSSQLPAMQVVHDYQVVTGLEPGIYAAEAWDAAGIIVTAVNEGASTRPLLAEAIGSMNAYDGVARTYRFDPDGNLEPNATVGVFRAQGVRWLTVSP
jgi:ABC-type branched-subunit amino acid transport system substrate-binding protein